MEDLEDDLDTSWIENAEFQDNYERESIKDIGLFFIYINIDGSIQQITKDSESVSNQCISKERVLHLIQSKRHFLGKKFRLIDLLSFYVTLEPDKLNDFIKLDNHSQFLKVLPIFNEIIFEPSIFIFHDLNGLYFFFKEVESFITKSILKNGIDYRHTKKIISPQEYFEKKKKSFKRMLRKVNKTHKI